jgi:integrase
MSDQLVSTLQGYIAEHGPIVWLFPRKSGAPIDPKDFNDRYWKPLFIQTGIRHRTPHALRHTYATYLIQRGENLVYVRDQMRHSSIKITVDTYSHLMG